MISFTKNPHEALEMLKRGNEKYIDSINQIGDISSDRREETLKNGQRPYAVIISCSDSRVIPEAIFSVGIGDLFVIRVAGNVIDNHQLGSVEYAAEHLGCGLTVVLGHTHCGAVDAAVNHHTEGYIRYITDEINKAVGEEKDGYKAAKLNALYSKEKIEKSLQIQKDEKEYGLKVIAAIYHTDSGKVEFLE